MILYDTHPPHRKKNQQHLILHWDALYQTNDFIIYLPLSLCVRLKRKIKTHNNKALHKKFCVIKLLLLFLLFLKLEKHFFKFANIMHAIITALLLFIFMVFSLPWLSIFHLICKQCYLFSLLTKMLYIFRTFFNVKEGDIGHLHMQTFNALLNSKVPFCTN